MSEWYRSLKGYKYRTTKSRMCRVDLPDFDHEFFYVRDGFLIVRLYYAWDGASGPTIDGPTNMRASLFHDALCQAIRENLLDRKYRKYADELFYKHLLEDKMKPWRAWIWFKAVRGYSTIKHRFTKPPAKPVDRGARYTGRDYGN